MGEGSSLDRPSTPETGDEHLTAEEKAALYLERSHYLLGQLAKDELMEIGSLIDFTKRLEQYLALVRREKIPTTLAYVDVDYFKQVNDTYGHPAGDAVLKNIGKYLKNSLREVDFVARIGGEEIAILLEGTSAEQAVAKLESLREGIESLSFEGYPDLKVTASFGATSLNGLEEAAEVRDHADKALYQAKQSGRNIVKIYNAHEPLPTTL